MVGFSRNVDDLVAAARSLGLDAGWDRTERAGDAEHEVEVHVRAWVDVYESATVVAPGAPVTRSVPRAAKHLLNSCLLARGAFDPVYDLAYRGSTNRTVPVGGSRSADSYPSRRHLELLKPTAQSCGSYAERGLHACLQALLPHTPSENGSVYRRGDGGGPIAPTITQRVLQVHDALVEDEWSFIVIYDYHDSRLGFRACVLDHASPGRYAWMYGDDLPIPPDPVRWGTDIASLDIKEPLGAVVEHLRYDSHGIGWWGETRHTTAAQLRQ